MNSPLVFIAYKISAIQHYFFVISDKRVIPLELVGYGIIKAHMLPHVQRALVE